MSGDNMYQRTKGEQRKRLGEEGELVEVVTGGSRVPAPVKATTATGVEPRALELAKLFMALHGRKARDCQTRSQLSKVYVEAVEDNTRCRFIPEEWEGVEEQRPFAQVLFAIAHGMKLVKVRGGRNLEWNRFRDNKGERLPEKEVERIRAEVGAGGECGNTSRLPNFTGPNDELAYLYNEMRRLHEDRVRMEDRIAYLERGVGRGSAGRGPPGRGCQGGRGDHRIGGTSRRQQYRQ
jgi:hypothetical protein